MDYFKDSGQFGAKLLMHQYCVEKKQKRKSAIQVQIVYLFLSKRVAIGGNPDFVFLPHFTNTFIWKFTLTFASNRGESIYSRNGDFLNENVRHNKSINK